jgi:3D (Asp-Asp-Asp) domain-containing protein
VDVTSYNSERSQTDSSPCVGAGGQNLCNLAKKGIRVLAVSQDLRKQFLDKKGQYYKYPAKVYVESGNPSIQGCYILADTMNKRFTKRIDLFFLTRKENQGCMIKDKCQAHISNKLEMCTEEFRNLDLTKI